MGLAEVEKRLRRINGLNNRNKKDKLKADLPLSAELKDFQPDAQLSKCDGLNSSNLNQPSLQLLREPALMLQSSEEIYGRAELKYRKKRSALGGLSQISQLI